MAWIISTNTKTNYSTIAKLDTYIILIAPTKYCCMPYHIDIEPSMNNHKTTCACTLVQRPDNGLIIPPSHSVFHYARTPTRIMPWWWIYSLRVFGACEFIKSEISNTSPNLQVCSDIITPNLFHLNPTFVPIGASITTRSQLRILEALNLLSMMCHNHIFFAWLISNTNNKNSCAFYVNKITQLKCKKMYCIVSPNIGVTIFPK